MEVHDRAQQQKRERARKRLVRDYKSVFGTENGKAVLNHLIMEYGVFRPVRIESHPTPNLAEDLAYRAGCQRVVLDVMNILEIDYLEKRQEFTDGSSRSRND